MIEFDRDRRIIRETAEEACGAYLRRHPFTGMLPLNMCQGTLAGDGEARDCTVAGSVVLGAGAELSYSSVSDGGRLSAGSSSRIVHADVEGVLEVGSGSVVLDVSVAKSATCVIGDGCTVAGLSVYSDPGVPGRFSVGDGSVVCESSSMGAFEAGRDSILCRSCNMHSGMTAGDRFTSYYPKWLPHWVSWFKAVLDLGDGDVMALYRTDPMRSSSGDPSVMVFMTRAGTRARAGDDVRILAQMCLSADRISIGSGFTAYGSGSDKDGAELAASDIRLRTRSSLVCRQPVYLPEKPACFKSTDISMTCIDVGCGSTMVLESLSGIPSSFTDTCARAIKVADAKGVVI